MPSLSESEGLTVLLMASCLFGLQPFSETLLLVLLLALFRFFDTCGGELADGLLLARSSLGRLSPMFATRLAREEEGGREGVSPLHVLRHTLAQADPS